MNKSYAFLCVAALSAAYVCPRAFADPLQVAFTFSGPNDSGSLDFLVQPTSTPYEYTAVAVNGSLDGQPVALLADGTAWSYGTSDNLLYVPSNNGGIFDASGIDLEEKDGTEVNFSYNGSYYLSGVTSASSDSLDTVTVTQQPPQPTVDFDFAFSAGDGSTGYGGNDFGSGVISAQLDALNPNEYLITGISGTTDGQAISTLLDANTYPAGYPNDNELTYPAFGGGGGSFLDEYGLSYQLADGTDIELYGNGGGDYHLEEGPNADDYALNDLTITEEVPAAPVTAETPEPGSIVLMGTGLVGLLGAARRRVGA